MSSIEKVDRQHLFLRVEMSNTNASGRKCKGNVQGMFFTDGSMCQNLLLEVVVDTDTIEEFKRLLDWHMDILGWRDMERKLVYLGFMFSTNFIG